jgi:copper(I)-binding protein
LIVPLGRFAAASRSAAAVGTVAALALSGCGAEEGFDPNEWNAPGQRARVGSVVIHYAHLAEPKGEPWERGDDVPASMWLYNEGPRADQLVSAQTPAAGSVEIVDANDQPLVDGVRLPPDELQKLGPGKTHLVLRDLREVVRGGDFVRLTVRFEDAGEVTFDVQSQVPLDDESPSPGP